MKRKFLASGLIATALLAGLILFSYETSDKILLSEDSHLVKQRILTKIPLGTDIKVAQEIMEKNGFSCSLIKGSEFIEDDSANGSKKYHKKADFLYCDKEIGWLLHKRWQVAIVPTNTHVSDVRVSFGTIAP